MSGAAGNAEPTGEGGVRDLNPPSGAGASWSPRKVKVKVRGQEREVTFETPEKELEAIQKGVAFDTNQAELNEERRRLREERAAELKQLEPLLQIDELLRKDPVKAKKVNAVLNDLPLPDDGDPGLADERLKDDPLAKVVKEQAASIARLESLVRTSLGGVQDNVGKLSRRESYRNEERQIRRKYPKAATEENIDRAVELAEKDGISLTRAFKEVTYDEIPELVRASTFEEFDIDPSRHTPERSEVAEIEGLGPLTPETLGRLQQDPDQYARFRPAIRAAKRRARGLQEAPR